MQTQLLFALYKFRAHYFYCYFCCKNGEGTQPVTYPRKGSELYKPPLFKHMILEICPKTPGNYSRMAFTRICESLKGVVQIIIGTAPLDPSLPPWVRHWLCSLFILTAEIAIKIMSWKLTRTMKDQDTPLSTTLLMLYQR